MPSSVIRAFGYDAERRELTVTFATGKVYVYALVPGSVADEMQAAFSKGAFFNRNIRDRYPHRERGTPAPSSLRDALKRSSEG